MKITNKQIQVVRECVACGAVEVDNDTLYNLRWKDLKDWSIKRTKTGLIRNTKCVCRDCREYLTPPTIQTTFCPGCGGRFWHVLANHRKNGYLFKQDIECITCEHRTFTEI